MAVGPTLAQLQNNNPTGGANITTRKCVGGTNAGALCNNDAECNSNNCFDYNIFDLTVNFRLPTGGGWTPTAAQMTTIQGYFPAINNTLADVTDKQMVLGTVALIVNNGAPNAVVQLNAGTCNVGGPCIVDADCGVGGVCDRGGGSTNTGGWGANGKITIGPYCLQNPLCFVHEFMHLVANVRDEYEGALDDGVDNNNNGQIDECQENQSNFRCFGGTNNGQPCVTNANCPGAGACRRIVCIDPGTLAVPGCLMRCCLANTGSELCFAGNHDPDIDTEQSQCRNNNDCWTQLGIEWPSVIQVPAGAPDPGPAVAPTTVEFLTPIVLDRFVGVIDRSGSMGTEIPRRIDVAITATRDFIDLLSNGTDFGLASFASSDPSAEGPPNPPGVDSSKDFPPEAGLRALSSVADRNAAKTAVDGLSTRTGAFTRIGAGLRQARTILLEAGGTITLNTTVLLLTDGLNNRPSDNPQADLDSALQELANDSIRVFVTCIGAARDSVQCSYIADQTAGRFVDSVETESLYDAFVEFAAEAQGHEISSSTIGTPISDGATSGDIPAVIEEGVEAVRFVVTWTKASSDLDLLLFGPDGSQVPVAEKVQASQGEFYLINNPDPGAWTMKVIGANVTDPPERFSARAIVDNKELSVKAGLAKSTILYPEAFLLSASPSMGLPIAGCLVSALVQKPDGSTEVFALKDDGIPPDSNSGDGLYQAEFRNFTAGDGIYTFIVTAKCHSPYFYQDSEPGVGPFPVVPTIGGFERTIRFSGTASNVPDNLPPVADICRDVRAECTGAMTPVMLDGTCSYDPEEGPLSYQWDSPTGTFADATTTPTGYFPLGFNEVSLLVTDIEGAQSGTDKGKVVIADTTSPVINNVTATPNMLWPPNHKMVPVTLSADVSDICDEKPYCRITSVSSNEPENGLGEGDTAPDWEITGDITVNLRAERSGTGSGRLYTIIIKCTDASANSSTKTVSVSVPHDKKK
jgi:hypothetical protein